MILTIDEKIQVANNYLKLLALDEEKESSRSLSYDIESYEKRRNFILQEIKMLEESKIQ